MKRGLVALLAGVVAGANVFAGGLEQNGKRVIDCGKYKVEARGLYSGSNGNGELRFELYDDDTRVVILDEVKTGIGDNGDILNCTHKFKTGEKLFIELRCRGRGGYGIVGRLSDKNGHFPEKENHFSYTDFDPDKNFIINILAMGKMNYLKCWGEVVYDDFVTSLHDGVKSNKVPYDEVKSALEQVKKLIPQVEKKKLTLGKALIKSSHGLVKHAKEIVRKESIGR